MTKDAINNYSPISVAQAATSVTLEASNGTIVDGAGNPVTLGGTEQGPDYYFSDEDEPVDRVKGATPTGDLRVNSDGYIYVDGYGTVTLTNAWGGREVDYVGGANGLDSSLDIDSSGNILVDPPDTTYTYSSGVSRVNNGDTTYHDTDTVASPIVIESAQTRWEGVTTSEGSTTTSTWTNTASEYTEWADGTWNQARNETITSSEADFPLDETFPYAGADLSQPSAEFDAHKEFITVERHDDVGDGNITWDFTYDEIDLDSVSGETITQSYELPADSYFEETVYEAETQTNYISHTRTFHDAVITENPYDFAFSDFDYQIQLATSWWEYTFQSTASTTFPSLDSGYDFDRHYYDLEWTNTTDTQQTIDYEYYSYLYTETRSGLVTLDPGETKLISESTNGNHVGENLYAKITNEVEGIDIYVEAQTTGTEDTTTYYHTNDPSVSGDVSASYSGELSDGEWSPWQTLSGLSPGSNQFDHSISESNKADWEFEYDYHYDTATVTIYKR